jgi:hypothetical protein
VCPTVERPSLIWTVQAEFRPTIATVSETANAVRRIDIFQLPSKGSTMPTFVALVYEAQDPPRDQGAPDFMSYMSRYVTFGEAAGSAIIGGAILMPDWSATTIEVQGGNGGKIVLTDGPHAECKEMLGGVYVLDAADLDAATALAAQIPSAWDGGRVEVRPTMSMSPNDH